MTTLESRLRALGDRLDLDGPNLADVLARIDADAAGSTPRRHTVLRVAAVVLLALTGITIAVPTSREAVAEWFGFGGVTIERDSGLVPPATADDIDDATESPAGSVITVDEEAVLVSSFPGTFEIGALTKSLGDGTEVERVDVDGEPGVWIDGDPHEMMYLGPDGTVLIERIAGNTLLWQDGALIRRLEGFASKADALAYASTVGD